MPCSTNERRRTLSAHASVNPALRSMVTDSIDNPINRLTPASGTSGRKPRFPFALQADGGMRGQSNDVRLRLLHKGRPLLAIGWCELEVDASTATFTAAD